MQYTNPYYVDTTEDKSVGGFANARLGEGGAALSGFSSGGLYGAAIGAAGSQLTGALDTVDNDNKLIDQLNQTEAGTVQRDEFGRPILNQNVSASTLSTVNTDSIGRIDGTLNRLNAGALWGAIPLIGGKKRRRRAEAAKRAAQARLSGLQEDFNKQNMSYQQTQQRQQQQAKQLQNRQNRLYSIPSQNSTFL